MKQLSLILLGIGFMLQITYAGKPNKAIYFPESTKTVLGTTFIKVGIGTRKEIKNKTFHTYYISTTKVSRAQFTSFLNDIDADFKITGIYKNDTCLLSNFRYTGACPVEWNYDSKKEKWVFYPKPLSNKPVGMVSIFGATHFCQWLQQKTGEHIRLPKPLEYRPTLPQSIKKYIRKNKKILSSETIDLVESLNIENSDPETEWAQNMTGGCLITNYGRECPKGLSISMLILSCTVAPIPITVPIAMFVKSPVVQFTPVVSNNTPMFPTAEPNLGFRLVIPDSVMP